MKRAAKWLGGGGVKILTLPKVAIMGTRQPVIRSATANDAGYIKIRATETRLTGVFTWVLTDRSRKPRHAPHPSTCAFLLSPSMLSQPASRPHSTEVGGTSSIARLAGQAARSSGPREGRWRQDKPAKPWGLPKPSNGTETRRHRVGKGREREKG